MFQLTEYSVLQVHDGDSLEAPDITGTLAIGNTYVSSGNRISIWFDSGWCHSYYVKYRGIHIKFRTTKIARKPKIFACQLR